MIGLLQKHKKITHAASVQENSSYSQLQDLSTVGTCLPSSTALQSLSGASPASFLALRFPAYVQTFSRSPEKSFSTLISCVPRLFLLNGGCTLPGLPVTGVEEQKVGVANGEAYGVFWIENGLGEILFWTGTPVPRLKIETDSAAADFFVASST